MESFEYIDRSGLEHFRFYRIPKILIEDEFFRDLSTDAKLLYGLLLDRLELSLQNDWFDEDGHVYIIFTLRDVEKQMNCSHSKAVRLLKELDLSTGIGLIRRVRYGLGQPDRIYVHNFITGNHGHEPHKVSKENVQKYENETSESLASQQQDVRKTYAIENEKNNTNMKETNQNEKKVAYGAFGNVFFSQEELEKLKKEFPYDWPDRIEALSEYMAANDKRYKNHLAVIRSWDRRERKRSYPRYKEEHYETENTL